MPIFEYNCNKCGIKFEKLVRKNDPPVECPECHSDSVTKAFSLFSASNSSGSIAGTGSCHTCSGHSCSCCH